MKAKSTYENFFQEGCDYYQEISHCDKAYDFYKKKYRVFKKINNAFLESLYRKISNYYKSQGNCDKALSYNEALVFLEKAKAHFEQSEPLSTEKLKKIYELIIMIYKGQPDICVESVEILEKVIKLKENELNIEKISLAESYKELGSLLVGLGKYEQAIEKALKAEQLLEGSSLYPRLSLGISLILADSYRSLCQYSLYIQSRTKFIEPLRLTYSEKHSSVYEACVSIGNEAYKYNEYNISIEYYEKALLYIDLYHKPYHPIHIQIYLSLTSVFLTTKNESMCLDYIKKTRFIYEKILDPLSVRLGRAYYDLGLISRKNNSLDYSIELLKKSLNIYVKKARWNFEMLFDICFNIGEIYLVKTDFANSLKLCEKSLEYIQKFRNKNHLKLGHIYRVLGFLYKLAMRIDIALACNIKSKEYYEKVLGYENYYVGLELYEIGDCELYTGNVEEAYNYFMGAKKVIENINNEQQLFNKIVGKIEDIEKLAIKKIIN